jgi:hypothetical protein
VNQTYEFFCVLIAIAKVKFNVAEDRHLLFEMFLILMWAWTKAARMLAVLLSKHEYDSRYQNLDDKLYIAQLYFPLVGMVSIANSEIGQ